MCSGNLGARGGSQAVRRADFGVGTDRLDRSPRQERHARALCPPSGAGIPVFGAPVGDATAAEDPVSLRDRSNPQSPFASASSFG